MREFTDAYGFSHVAYRQIYQGVPVFASDLRGHFDASGALTGISATTVPIARLDPVPGIGAAQAEAIAVAEVRRTAQSRNPPSHVRGTMQELVVFRSGLIRGVSGGNHLAWRVEVLNSSRTLREHVFVDAHSGEIIDRINAIADALQREIHNGNLGLVWQEGDPLPFNGKDSADVNRLIEYDEDTYNLFLTMSDGAYPSYNGGDAVMRSVVNHPFLVCPNANWNGETTNYCAGVTGDDTVAHEWAHAYTEYTHNLVYQWQPGALNESFSDIFGEVVDMLNGAGTDLPDTARAADGSACSIHGAGVPASDDSYRWLSGEDDPAFGGAIRDLWRPECFGDPGKVSSSRYWCQTGDQGGVHFNSGVPNHAFALMVDGGSYNGQVVAPIGLTKAAQIYWRAMTIYQGPATDFADHADALEASCFDLVGQNLPALDTDTAAPASSGQVISAGDCAAVSAAIDAVELRTEPTQCPFEPVLNPYPLPLCYGHGELTTYSLTDWESGLGAWTADVHDVANLPTFDTDPWAVVSGLPDERTGSAAFVADLNIGNCADDDESGAISLDSPPIQIPPGTVVPRIAIDHWLASEAGWDGGNFKISVNGGPFTLVPASSVDFSPYNGTLMTSADGNTNPLAGEDAFTGTDEGIIAGSWGQSHVNLAGIAEAGDTVQLRFDFGVDGCSGVHGWYVDDVRFFSCSDELPPSDCGNGVLDADEQCDDGNTYIGDGCSNACQVESGWQCTAPTPPAEILDPGFEAGTPNPAWIESSTNFGSPICSEADCGTGGGTGAASGAYWAWFGGIQSPEEASLSQSVTIPQSANSLQFALEVNACDSGADYLEVLIDANPVFVIDGSNPRCGLIGYAVQTVDIGSYADDGPHVLEFHSQSSSDNGGVTNFFVDDIEIPGSPSECALTSASTIKLVKIVVNDDSGTLTQGDFPSFVNGSPQAWDAVVEWPAGDYTASEISQPGYSSGPWGGDCAADGSITLESGQNAVCTITNDDVPYENLIFLDGFESN